MKKILHILIIATTLSSQLISAYQPQPTNPGFLARAWMFVFGGNNSTQEPRPVNINIHNLTRPLYTGQKPSAPPLNISNGQNPPSYADVMGKQESFNENYTHNNLATLESIVEASRKQSIDLKAVFINNPTKTVQEAYANSLTQLAENLNTLQTAATKVAASQQESDAIRIHAQKTVKDCIIECNNINTVLNSLYDAKK